MGEPSGAGVKIPLEYYSSIIIDQFPRSNRIRNVESSIASTQQIDVLPVNLPINQRLRDNYLEFRIPGTQGAFLDLANIVIDFKVSLTKDDDTTKLEEDDHVEFVNGLSNTMFEGVQVFLGEQVVETNTNFNYWSFIKLITSLPPSKMSSLGRIGGFRRDWRDDDGIITNEFTNTYFTEATAKDKKFMGDLKSKGLSMCFPLLLDISSLDQYILDNIDMRLRLELSPHAWVLNTSVDDGSKYRLHMDYAKLWVTRVFPYPSAYLALNSSLLASPDPITYTFNRTISKTYVLARNQTSLLIDQPWAQVIPHKIYMIIVPMNYFAGLHQGNGLYFENAKLKSIAMYLNNNAIYRIGGDFDNHYSRLYYETLKTLGLERDSLLAYDSFNKGRSIFTFDLTTIQTKDSLPVEKSGNLHMELEFGGGVTYNRLVLLFGETTGVLSIDGQRTVLCDVRA
ncbi:uncharacterized protein [Procambarus clarkii]|uniref:uncharacterized protein isoform X1 n=1 Tax=Procambarus clarkii TaxID=6728 RepID=UPI00374407CE